MSFKKLLDGKVALIVGSGRGLGEAIALAYAREGAQLVCADLDLAAARQTLEACGQSEGGAAEALDISDAQQCSRLVEKTGKIDVMVNCAAMCLVDPILEVAPEAWDKVFAVNARGAFFIMQAAARGMVERGYGRIIQITSPAAKMGFPNFASYAASKAAVDSMVRAGAVAWGQHGVTVNSIAPGRMTGGMIDELEVELSRVTGKSAAELKAERTKGLPIPRRVEPVEVAEAAVWLASDAAAYVNGERVNFTGGMELS